MISTELWAHQKEAIARAKNLPYYALHFEAGTGKTRTAIEIIKERINRERRILRTLIFCPDIVIQNWREEWFKFSNIDKKDVIALTGSGAQRLKIFKQHAYNETGLRRGKIFICNYQSLLMEPLYEEFKKWSPDQFVHDEAHRCKNHQAKMAQALDKLVNVYCQPSLRLNLTGTSILNGPQNLFMQFKILMGGFPTLESMLTGKHITNYYHFQKLFFEDGNAAMKTSARQAVREAYFPNWQPKPSTNDLFGRLLASYSMSVTKADCLDLPPRVNITVPVPLTREQRLDYEKFEKDMVLNVEGKNYTADIAMTKALRLMQLASGFISGLDAPDEGEAQPIKHVYKDTNREALLKEYLQEICVDGGKKCLVWSVWQHNYGIIKKVCDELKIKYVECHGLVSSKGKEEARKSFITDPSIMVWLGHPYSGGIGVNLVVAPYTIWYSYNFSREQFEQAQDRNYRGGQTQNVTQYFFTAADTIEPEILDSLQNKKDISDLIMNRTNIYKLK